MPDLCHMTKIPARRHLAWVGFLFTLAWGLPADAATVQVAAQRGVLQAILSKASPGDVVQLLPGVHKGPLRIEHSLIVEGQTGAIVDGGGKGRVITIDAPDVVVRGLIIRGSGDSLATEDSAIFITKKGDRALVAENRLEGNLIGVNLKGPENAVVRDNHIEGSRIPRVNDRGNGVQLWNTPGSVVEGNDIRYGRDGIFVTTSHDNVFRNNRFEQLRFAVHYMYTHDSEISGNVSRGNHVGFALMYSDRLVVDNNYSLGDRDRGLFLNYVNYSTLDGNLIKGAEKCVFIYNANMNSLEGNRFEDCQIGIHFTGGSEQNRIDNNAFIENRSQVKYVGSRHIEWSEHGWGNYWSDHVAYDIDGDGIADRAYRPNDLADQVMWRRPLAKLLLNSPAVQVLRWAQSAFPTIFPGGVTDSAPLMTPPGPEELIDG